MDGALQNDINFHHFYLGCETSGHPHSISLVNMNDTVFVRERPKELAVVSLMRRDKARTIYIARDWDNFAIISHHLHTETGIRIRFASAEPYHFAHIEAWPPGLYDRMYKPILTRELLRFFGYIKFGISGPSLTTPRDQLPSFIAVYFGDLDNGVSVCLLGGDQAVALMTYSKSISDLNPVDTEAALMAYFSALVEQPRQDITLGDRLNGPLLHISVTADACRWPKRHEWSQRQQDVIKLDLMVD
ncbi:hypothetical protein GLAREA_01575 [Glarea lozoyensis ATCC 20868]|uniref:Uncharacterized protein n=1 Tax=Glarea lozoyensis (strain ATCC 20868 / MF5171) TaxID=1116229 RepID=S3DGC9_GLAL2|nr:uncharacterized protein GLAREA_01575 [Glarea lozoyensis ATCC 20868]EPE25663.1 hypothetical protein GLAREA_01575 [Glarea lozoyensis ATCC 20868]